MFMSLLAYRPRAGCASGLFRTKISKNIFFPVYVTCPNLLVIKKLLA